MNYDMILNSPKETADMAKTIAKLIKNFGPAPENATVIALKGELGAGKTAFTKTFLKELGIKEGVISPTFIIMKSFKAPLSVIERAKFKNIYHIDAYRVTSEDLVSLDFKEIIKNPKNLIVIEWADRVKKIIPKEAIWIELKHGSHEKQRIMKIK